MGKQFYFWNNLTASVSQILKMKSEKGLYGRFMKRELTGITAIVEKCRMCWSLRGLQLYYELS